MESRDDRIIIIDDIQIVASMIEDTLQDAGFKNTHIYNNPLVALKEIMTTTRPAVIITDYNMPEMNGIELIQKVEQRYKKIDAIIVTSENPRERTFSGKYPVLEKDSDFIDHLVEFVTEVIKKHDGGDR